MINATRLIKTLDEKGCLQLNLPEFSAQQVEIVILPIKQDDTAEAMQLAVLQSQ
ncbi:MAG: hypothetical protein K9L22_08140 [Methylococcaceae bacterium]|nr:hypothetical protein [Methylococcaceae bacterium]